jgi:hypothetical protein
VWVSELPHGTISMPNDIRLNQSRITRSSDCTSRTPSPFESATLKPFQTSRALNDGSQSGSSGSRR